MGKQGLSSEVGGLAASPMDLVVTLSCLWTERRLLHAASVRAVLVHFLHKYPELPVLLVKKMEGKCVTTEALPAAGA